MNKIIKTIMDGGKRAAMYTSMMVCTIALMTTYSCSADGEYDEPWVNKEHRTRAGLDNTALEHEIGIFIGDTISCLYNSSSSIPLSAIISWNNGTPTTPHPQPHITFDWDRTDPSFYYIVTVPTCYWLDVTEGAVAVEYGFTYKLMHDTTAWNGETVSTLLSTGSVSDIKEINMHYSNR